VLDEYSSFLTNWSSNKALDAERIPQDDLPDSQHLLARLSAVHRLAGDPRLLGVEAFWLFVEIGEHLNVALVQQDGRRQRFVLSLPAHSHWFSGLANDARALRVQLSRDAGWTLYLQPRSDRSVSPACRTLAALVQSLAVRGPAHHERAAARLPAHPTRDPRHDPVFVSESMDAIVRTIPRVAATTLPVLITGETGTGKDVLARLIHRHSSCADGPFVPFNCATVPKDLLDSQLFGYRRGAFTGAHDDFPGIIRAAEGGTLFLDEIGDLGADAQPKLLRFLESGELHPLGDVRPMTATVRVIAATNARLDVLVPQGRFRQDLLYRLDAVRYRLPPLRERRDDIPALADHFLAVFSEEFQKGRVRIAATTLDYLLLHAWPGNVRQLANEIRRAVALADPDAVLQPDCLSVELVAPGQMEAPAAAAPAGPLANLVVNLDQPIGTATAQLERAMLAHALRQTGGRVDAAARRLGLSRKGLYLKRQRLDIDSGRPRAED
jgi:DNA-binding NtrC family response regulator